MILLPRTEEPSEKWVNLVLTYNKLELTDHLLRVITDYYKQGHGFVSAANQLKVYLDGPK